MIVFISVLSFFLDGILSKYISPTSIFLPLFTVVSLVIIYPYFNNNNYRYFRYIAILGLLYDITYLNTLFMNFFIFILIGFFVGLFNYLLSNNIYTNVMITIVTIILYRVCHYLFIVIFKSQDFNFMFLLKNVYSSLILNVLYCMIIYFFSEIFSKKYKILRSK